MEGKMTLLPCPLCGSATALRVGSCESFHEDAGDMAGGYQVTCCAGYQKKGCGCSTGWQESEEEAIAAWNRRAPPDAIRAAEPITDETIRNIASLYSVIPTSNVRQFVRECIASVQSLAPPSGAALRGATPAQGWRPISEADAVDLLRALVTAARNGAPLAPLVNEYRTPPPPAGEGK